MAAGGQHGTRAVVVAMLASAALAAAKVAAFLVTGAASLLAGGIHSAADTASQGLLLLGRRRARRAEHEEHPFGYGRERYFWGFALSVTLFVLGAGLAVSEGIHRLRHPEPLESPAWAYGVLGVAIVVEGLALRTAVVEANEVRRRATWVRFVRNARSPALPVVLLEHLAALAGLVVALAAVTTAEVTGDPAWDGAGALAVGILLGIVAIVLVSEMRSLLIGRAASRREVETIRAAVEVDPSVRRLVHMRTQHQGPEELLVGMKVELDHTLTFPEVSEVVNRIERTVRQAVPVARAMYIEPDVTDARRAAPAIGEHVPQHEVPAEIRAKQKIEDARGALGVGIPVEDEPQ